MKNVRVVPAADSTHEEDNCAVTAHGNKKEDVQAEMVASDHDEENSESVNTTEEEAAATSEPEKTSEDSDVKTNEVSEQQTSHQDSAVFQVNSSDGDGPPSLHLETPERQNSSPTAAEEEDSTAEDSSYEDIQPKQEQCEDRGEPRPGQRHSLLQMKLAEFFQKKAGDAPQLDRDVPVSEQEYETYVNLLTELKQQLSADSESAQQQAEELRLKAQHRLDKVCSFSIPF